MDISKITGGMGTIGQKRDSGKSAANGFGEILDKAILDARGVAEEGIEEVSRLNSASASPAIDRDPGALNTVQHAEKVLNLMDQYANALSDPKRTLKSIEPIVREIQTEVSDLPVVPDSQRGGLQGLVNDIAVTASVEAIKFHRGDYVS
jgi:hypothetical protein